MHATRALGGNFEQPCESYEECLAIRRRATWLCHDMIDVNCAEGGARDEEGVTRAPEAPGLGLSPRTEILGRPVAVYQ
jgi:hypothetical protein